MNRHQLGSLLGLSFALSLALVACGEDNDILAPAPPAPPAPPPTNTDTELDDTDHLTSGGACVPTECGVAAPSVGCCTTDADVTGNAALEAGKCGVDMSAFGGSCAQLNQPGVLDTACPEVNLGGPAPLAGCCTASGHCGAMDTFFPLGCSSNPDASTWVACGS